LEAMFANLPVGVLQIDADRTVRAANPAMAEMIGLREDEIVGRRCFQLVGDESHFCDHCLFNRTDVAITRHTRTLHRGTRNERILDTTIVRVPGTNGDDPTVLELAHDVTDERRLEAQLIQSSKLASIGQLASGLAHEINNPLGTILLRTDSLLADVSEQGLPDDIREDVEAIQRQASRVSRITEELLTFSRCTNVERGPVDVNAVIESAMVIVGLRAEKHVVTVERATVEDVSPVYGNTTQLEQVVVNLLANAIDASRPDSVVTVGARTVREEMNCPVEIWVEDSGSGIAEDELEHIFDPFYSTKDVGEGTGLGLSISYGIVTAHDGTITVSSRYGEGTVVRVRLARLSDTELEVQSRKDTTAERASTA
ncbi:MAG TPA: PAS domain S-box protein, partial [Firmicutes bacterium]|nr:PAS domain S-box protein [Bacillota bacterium]